MATIKLKRDIFSRGVRMQHQFGELIERCDPLGTPTFEASWPMRITDTYNTDVGSFTSQEFGLHNDRPDSSPVIKPNGQAAHTDSSIPDAAMETARPVPVGTKRRYGPPRTDK